MEAKGKKISRALKYGFVSLPKDISRSMIVRLFIAALISAFVPDDFFAEYLGTGITAMIVMLFLGIPVYVCATASVPVAAAMMLKGLTPGAAIVFLMTGPATNAASFVTIWKNLGTKTALIYLLTVIVCALISGLILNLIAGNINLQQVTEHGLMIPNFIKNISAIALITILTASAINKKKH
jgi:hypothetical protein